MADLEDDPGPLWTARAIADLEAIGEYIARDKPLAARRWVDTLTKAAEHAAALPLAGRRVPELSRDDIREVIKRGYRLVYRVRSTQVEILTVFEGHRRLPPRLLDDEQPRAEPGSDPSKPRP